jgi:cell division protein FtsB
MKKRPEESNNRSPALAIVFSAIVLSFLLSFFMGQSGILRLRQLRNEYDALLMENHKLALENRLTREEIKKLKTDPALVEKIAREELHFVSPHDTLLLVPSGD